MKTMNVKKLAVLATGAAMLAGAFAAAAAPDVDSAGLGAYKFFVNGKPNVKIAVGAKALASDGIAAGNIAAMIANLAYKDMDVVITNAATALSCGASEGATCAGTSATLDVTVPSGAAAATVGAGEALLPNGYIADYLDNDYYYDTTRANSGTGYEVKNANFPGVVYKGTVTVGTKSYTQEDRYYVKASNYYDTSSDYKQLVAGNPNVTYVTEFSDPIPYHIASTNTTFFGDPDTYRTQTVGAKIKFLGQDFTITDFTGTTDSNPSLTPSKITLGAGTFKQTISKGSAVQIGDVTVTLTSVEAYSTASGGDNIARFSVSKAGVTPVEAVVYERTATVDSTTLSNQATKLGVTVKSAGAGSFNVAGGTATVSVFSSALDLTSGSTISFADSAKTDANTNWTVYLDFQNVITSDTTNVIALKRIRLTPSSTLTKIKAGDAVGVVNDPKFMQLTFVGPETVDQDIVSMAYDSYLNTGSGDGRPAGTYYKVKSSTGSNFEVNTSATSGYQTVTTDTIYLRVNANVPYYRVSNGTYLQMFPWSSGTDDIGAGYANYTYPSQRDALVHFVFKNSTDAGSLADQAVGPYYENGSVSLVLKEDLRDDSPSLAASGLLTVKANMSNTSTYFYASGTTNPTLSYAASGVPAGGVNGTYEIGYITPRGSKIESISQTEVKYDYAKRTAKVMWKFGAVSVAPVVNVSTPVTAGATRVTTNVGDTYDLGNGYKVKVVSAAANPSGATGARAVAGISDLVTDPAKANVVVALAPSDPLVISDAAAAGVDQVIAVGGPAVNDVTAAALPASTYTFDAGKAPIVKVVGSKIVVAGWTAQDTADAAQALVNWLDSQRTTIRS